jgi:hypothetical protein
VSEPLFGWADELDQFLAETQPPEPKRGGTWLYCPRAEPVPVGRLCWYRTKSYRKYLRHWRRRHG